MESRYTEMQYVEAKRMHAEGHSLREIARRLDVSDHKIVAKWVSGRGKPACMVSTLDYHNAFVPREGYEGLTTTKAYLLGCVCGDASLWLNRKARYVGICVTDRDFAEAFASALNEVYGSSAVVSRRDAERCRNGYTYNVQLGSRLVCDDIDRWLEGRHRTDEWRVPKCIREGSAELKCAFLRGFFDSEGTASRRANESFCVAAFSSNKPGIDDVLSLLASLGIAASLWTMKASEGKLHFAASILTRSFRDFHNKVGFTIARKQQALAKYLGGAS